jgi:High-temperature-induced dauer-formation protein
LLTSNKCELLHLLLVLLSNRTMYAAPSCAARDGDEPAQSSHVKSFHSLLHSIVPRKTCLSLFCSLLNTALRIDAGGILAAGERMMTRRKDVDAALVNLSLQTLAAILLDSPVQADSALNPLATLSPRSDPPQSAQSPPPQTSKKQAHGNRFAWSLSKLHRPVDFAFLLQRTLTILAGPAQGNVVTAALPVHLSTLTAPTPSKSIGPRGVTEALIVLWRAWEVNPVSFQRLPPALRTRLSGRSWSNLFIICYYDGFL